MSDAVQIAWIAVLGPVAVAVVGRWLGGKIDKVHTLVNSGSTEQLRVGMISARALAAVQPTGENIELARIAEEKYNRSVAK